MKIAAIFFLLFILLGLVIEDHTAYRYYTNYADEDVVCEEYKNGKLYNCKIIGSYPVRGYGLIEDPKVVTKRKI